MPSTALFRRAHALALAVGLPLVLAACAAPPIDAASAGLGTAAPRRVDTAVGLLAVHEAGRGDTTVVFWPSILADHAIYQAQVRALGDRYRLLLIDGPGHGASGPAPGPFSMRSCADALAAVLDAAAVRGPVVVVGTSWGGLVAGEFALAHPRRTAGIVMLNTPVLPANPGFADRFVTWGARHLHGTALYSTGVARAFFLPETRAQADQTVMQRFAAHLHAADGHALSTAVRSVLIEREALAPRMSGIDVPTLFIAGDQDDMYPMATLREAASTLPKGRFEVVRSGHISVVDAPAETTALIQDFLARVVP